MNATRAWILLLAVGVLLTRGEVLADPMDYAFTYQGRLLDGGAPAEGDYDFEFTLYDHPDAGSEVAEPISKEDQAVDYGLFTLTLDFGNDVFTGDARWLKIGVRPWDSTGAYTYLTPRQELTPAPYALALLGLWTQQNATSPNLVGGYSGNSVEPGTIGATIGGGGASLNENEVLDSFGTIGGGLFNQAGSDDADPTSAKIATVGGGDSNTASGFGATVAGGRWNQATAAYGTIAGGGGSLGSLGNRVTDDHGTIGGGGSNQAGDEEEDTTNATYATVGGGEGNSALFAYSTVGGGHLNWAFGEESTVGGEHLNVAFGEKSTVGGGEGNGAIANGATVSGGIVNFALADSSTVGGGEDNEAGGTCSTVPGGCFSTATGDYSFAAGRRAKAENIGAFVWADSNDFDFPSTAADEFSARATGGVRFVTAVDGSGTPMAGVKLDPGDNMWEVLSDRNAKENFVALDATNVLKRLAHIPVTQWNYKCQHPSNKHIGPMAQDFYAAFGLSGEDRYISPIDTDGVALLSIQGLYHMAVEKEAEIAAQREEIATLRARLEAIEVMLAKPTDMENGGAR
jgi:hypothetical protein